MLQSRAFIDILRERTKYAQCVSRRPVDTRDIHRGKTRNKRRQKSRVNSHAGTDKINHEKIKRNDVRVGTIIVQRETQYSCYGGRYINFTHIVV